MLMTGHANEQWQVTDDVTHRGLQDVNDMLKEQTNKRLEELREQSKIGTAERSATEDPHDPGVTLQKDKPATIQSTIAVEELRCGEEPDADKGILRDRWTVCSEIVNQVRTASRNGTTSRGVWVTRTFSRAPCTREQRARCSHLPDPTARAAVGQSGSRGRSTAWNEW